MVDDGKSVMRKSIGGDEQFLEFRQTSIRFSMKTSAGNIKHTHIVIYSCFELQNFCVGWLLVLSHFQYDFLHIFKCVSF